MILQVIKEYWEYQKSDRPPGTIGMSAIGHCGRQLGYVKHLTFHQDHDWRAKIIFDDGNRHHDQIRKAIREGLALKNSCFSLVGEEEEVCLGILKGHVDGILKHDDEACKGQGHETMLLEVKSMNERAFEAFKKDRKLPYEYECQVSAYLRASGYDTADIVIKNKNTGEMDEMLYKENGELLDSRLEILAQVVDSNEPEDVQRDYSYDAKTGKLPWQCGYCPYVELCWRHEGVKEVGRHKYQVPTAYAKNIDTLRKLSTKVANSDTTLVPPPGETIGTVVALQALEGTNEQTNAKAKGRKGKKKGR